MEVLIELGGVSLDGKVLRGVQLMPFGKWSHPLGPIEMDFNRAKRFEEQFKKGVAGQSLPLFYIHSSKENVSNPLYGKAAGWFVDLRADESRGLVADIELTDEGLRAIERKEYRYLSAEFFDKVKLPHHVQTETDVMMGAALVNRPHLKGMTPILNEETGHQLFVEAQVSNSGGGPVDRILRALAERAGVTLSEDQTELTEEQRQQIDSYLSAQEKALSETAGKVSLLERRLSEFEDKDSQKQRTLAEAGFAEEAKELAELRADRFVTTLSESLSDGMGLTKAGKDAVRAYALDSTRENAVKVFELMASGKATIQMKELGSVSADPEGDQPDETAQEKLLAKTRDVARERSLSFADATNVVIAENPELWNQAQLEVGAAWATKEA